MSFLKFRENTSSSIDQKDVSILMNIIEAEENIKASRTQMRCPVEIPKFNSYCQKLKQGLQ